jgi:hypothetical protein
MIIISKDYEGTLWNWVVWQSTEVSTINAASHIFLASFSLDLKLEI